MKRHMKHRRYPAPAQVEPDIAGLINKMQEQLVSLEKKIDILVSKSSPKPVEAKPFINPFQQPGHARSHGEGSPEGRSAASYRGGSRHDNNYRERILHKAICADCKKECEVPFKPSGDRPVYCKECFSKRKAGSPEGRPAASYRGGGNSLKERSYSRPREAGPAQTVHIGKPQGGEKKKFAEKKKPSVKRRKAR